MYKESYKFRLYPTPAQVTKLEQTLELCRWTYNKYLTYHIKIYEKENRSCGRFGTGECINKCKKEKPELYNVHSCVFHNINERVDLAFRNFFQRLKKKQNPGFPRYKGIGQYKSFTYPTYGGSFCLLSQSGLHLSKIGMIKIIKHREIPGNCYIKRVTIIKKNDKWFCCLQCENKSVPIKSCGSGTVGIDLGCKTFAVLSNGKKIKSSKFYQKSLKRIQKANRKLQSTKEKTIQRKKAVKVLNKIHFRINNRRTNFLHQESRKLVNKYENLIFEDLDIESMVKGSKWRSLNRTVTDSGWNTFVKFCSYKAENAGGRTVLVSSKNTTKMCSRCGTLVEKALNERTHNCPNCGLRIDRDLNSSINILRLGQQSLRKLEDL